MGSRLLRLGGLLAAASLLVVGCAGDADEIDESESPLTVPPPTSESPTADAVLDLETMTDEELLAEAERAYSGMLEALAEVRESDDPNYSNLSAWTTPEYIVRVEETMSIVLEPGTTMRNAPKLVWAQLANQQVSSDSVARAHICVDNSDVRTFDSQGNDVTSEDRPEASLGTVTFVLSADADRLLVDLEQALDENLDRECAP